jgi:hypothetical protein
MPPPTRMRQPCEVRTGPIVAVVPPATPKTQSPRHRQALGRADSRADHGIHRCLARERTRTSASYRGRKSWRTPTHRRRRASRRPRLRSRSPIQYVANGTQKVSSPTRLRLALERVIDGNRSYVFFPGIEADRGTEPLDPSALNERPLPGNSPAIPPLRSSASRTSASPTSWSRLSRPPRRVCNR